MNVGESVCNVCSVWSYAGDAGRSSRESKHWRQKVVRLMRMVRGDDSSVWVMSRDEQMLEWFSIVRVSNMETIRWVLER